MQSRDFLLLMTPQNVFLQMGYIIFHFKNSKLFAVKLALTLLNTILPFNAEFILCVISFKYIC